MDKEMKQEVYGFSDQMDKNEKNPRLGSPARSNLPQSRTGTGKLKSVLSSILSIVAPAPEQQLSSPTMPPKLPSTESKLYLFFWHAYSPVMYSLYEVPITLHSSCKIRSGATNPKSLQPIIQLETGKYPDGMCCVQLDSMLYFLGGEMNFDNPYIDEDVKKELVKNVKRDVFPQVVYNFDLNQAINFSVGEDLRVATKSMNSGKANPLAFVANKKIYVIGSTHQDLDENFTYFEMFDPEVDKWIILPNPPIRNVNTIWVAHVVVGRKAVTVAWQQEKERLYCFDLDTHEWSNTSIPDYLGNFSGNTEFVENSIYGCYYDTVAAIAPLEEEEEEEEEAEEKELQQLFKHHRLHQVSEEKGMDTILNVPPQVQYSSSLLHLRNMYFCYVRTGMPAHPDPDLASDLVTEDDTKRFISITIFQASHVTYEKDDTRFFRANFIRSEHYKVNTEFPNEGFIKGCYFLGSVYFSCLFFVSSLLLFFVSTYHMNTSVVSWDLTMLDLFISTHKTWDDGGKHMICATGMPRVEQTDQRLRWGGLGQKMSKRFSIAKVPLNPSLE